MRAAVLDSFGSKLRVTDVPDPESRTGEVIVDVVAAPVLPYAGEVFSGLRRYMLTTPVIPGCGAIGRVRSVGRDATQLAKGDWVLCDPTVRSRDDRLTPDITLQGWSARGEGGMRLQEYFHDGPFAQQIRVPTENAIRLGTLTIAEASIWCSLVTLLVPYGGMLAGKLQAGETVLVSGATGNYGSSAVAVALAMGAACVVAPGRNQAVLKDLASRFGSRVRTVVLTGDEDKDRNAMKQSAPGPVDMVFDMLPPSAPASAARTAIMCVRQGGRAILMGGVGMLGGEGLELPYPWIMRNLVTIRGQWMYPPEAVGQLAALIRSGLLDLRHFSVDEFSLEDTNEAVDHASQHGGPFQVTVIKP